MARRNTRCALEAELCLCYSSPASVHYGAALSNARRRIPGKEPALILLNYGTNDALHKSNPSDTQASIIQSLAALRRSAPDAQNILIIPFGQYYAKELMQAVAAHQQTHPAEKKLAIIDLGPDVARALAAKNGVLGGLHPNDRGHAVFAAKIIPQVLGILGGGK